MSTEVAPARPETSRASWLYRLLAFLLVPVFRVVFRLRWRGVENVPESGFVLCANQSSNVDALVLATPLYPRVLHSMGKAELHNRAFGPLLHALGSFPVHRDRVDPGAIGTAVELARAGAAVCIFPEGTRRAKGLRKKRRAEPHSGAAFVALLANVPVVPAAIRGTDRITRLRPWRIAYGEPIAIEPFAGMPRREARRELTDRLWQRILELEAELAEEAR